MNPFLEIFESRMLGETSLKPLLEISERDMVSASQLRILDVIADLSHIKPWLRHPDIRTNWKETAMRAPIFHFEKILRDHYAQSFMVLIDGKQEVQLDLKLQRPAFGLSFGNKLMEDAEISYLYPWSHRKPGVFSTALELLSTYYFSFTEKGSLFLRIPDGQPETTGEAIKTGFYETEKWNKTTRYKLTKELFEKRIIDY